jgi:hypothetical protein
MDRSSEVKAQIGAVVANIKAARVVEKPFQHLEFDLVFSDDIYAKMLTAPAGSLSPAFGVYLVHLITRNSFGLMTRKLSVTESQRSAQFRGTFSRRKLSVASANWAHVA